MITRPSLSQIRWRCRRGMLELDVLLDRFVERRYRQLTDIQARAFVDALGAEDDELWDWLSGRVRPKKQRIADIVDFISQCR